MYSRTETNFVLPGVKSEVYTPTQFAGPRCRNLKLIGGSVFGDLLYEGKCGYKTKQNQMQHIGEKDNLCLRLAFALQTNVSVF
jgi:hypothetical protein